MLNRSMKPKHILVRIGTLREEPQYEPVHVEEVGNGLHRLLYSPGLAYDVAAGDTISVREDRSYTVVDRGGNLALRVYAKQPLKGRETELASQLAMFGGVLDGQVSKGLVFTVPAERNFAQVTKAVNAFVAKNSDCIWEYGNAYDEQGRPLEWCREIVAESEA
jgi:hypothetical protein